MKRRFLAALLLLAASSSLPAAPQRLSEDRDLKELNLESWNCLNKLEGSARTPDGVERNRLKNRSAVELAGGNIERVDVPGFLKLVSSHDTQTKGRKRKDLNGGDKSQRDPLEAKVVQLTGYLALYYAGPPETTNCASVDFHDWHLEITEKPPDHPPQVGDPTPIVCEITPRTQNAIYHDNIRLQELAAFFRRSDLTYEPTGHKAVKVRLTGYLLWDDEHNGSADVGVSIQRATVGRFHNPWRGTAWELHPAIKVERADGAAPAPASRTPVAEPTPGSSPAPSAPEATPAVEATPVATPPPVATPTPQQLVTVLQPVRIKIPYGETTLPRGTQLRVISRDAQSVTVAYMGKTYTIPITSTDLH